MKTMQEKLFLTYNTHNLVTLNDRLPTILFQPYPKRSIIDLALVLSNLASQCLSHTVQDTAGSDHFPISTSISSCFNTKNIFLYKLKISKKDLSLLNHVLYDSLKNMKSNLPGDTLEAYQQVEQHILLYSFFPSDSHLPRSHALRKRPPPPSWWNETFTEIKLAWVSEISVCNVFPQGSTLILFDIYLKDITKHLHHEFYFMRTI